jgi:hypothetical protein
MEHEGGASESSIGVEFEKSINLFKGNWATPIGRSDFLAENCRHQCVGQISFASHEFSFNRLRFEKLWVWVPRPIQRRCASNSNRTQQIPQIPFRLKTTFLKRSDQIGVNNFFQLTDFVQDSDRVPIRESANYGSTEETFFLHRSGLGGKCSNVLS